MKKDVHSIRVLNEYVMPNLTKRNELKLGDMPITFHDIKLNQCGDMCAVQCTLGGESVCKLYLLKPERSGWKHKELWKSNPLVTPIQGFHSVAFSTDEMLGNQFLNLTSNNISVHKFLNNDIVKRKRNITLPKAATAMAVSANSCEWHRTYVAAGLSNGTVLVHSSDHRVTYKTTQLKSNILSVSFSLQDALLFGGCRNGTCFVWDSRRGPSPIMSVKEPPVGTRLSSSVINLHPLDDYNYLISNALNSQLSMWDLRMQRKVLLFNGHVNNYKSCKSVVDGLGSFVAAVGSDGNVRIWSTRTGAILFHLHTSNQDIPLITFSESLGGAGGKPSLLVTENNSILIYHV